MSIVWLASYPKSGNTWLRTFLTNYLAGGDGPASSNALINALIGAPIAIDRRLFDEHTGPQSCDLTREEILERRPIFHELLAAELPNPTFVKVHDACLRTRSGTLLFPRTATVGVVYLVRNPLDVVVSFADYTQVSVDRAAEFMSCPGAVLSHSDTGLQRDLPQSLLTWSGHVLSWLEQEELTVHVERYEDMLADPVTAFGAIVRFAGLDANSVRLLRSIGHARFDRLQAEEKHSGFSERHGAAPAFFRSGRAGQWRSVLSVRQVRAVVNAHAPVMERYGYLDEAEAFLTGTAMESVS